MHPIFKIARRSLLLLALPLALLTTGCFRVDSDTRALREAVTKAADVQFQKKFELGTGFIAWGVAHAGLSFAKIDSDARTALQAVKGADVCIYQLDHHRRSNAAILNAADAVMEQRGWERCVGVSSDNQLVAVYFPVALKSARNMRVSVIVLSQDQLVVASANSDVRSLVQLGMQKIDRRFPEPDSSPHTL